MPTTAGVGRTAQLIQGVFADTVSIQNIGPGIVYLGSDSSVTPATGWQLPARAMGTWAGGTQLWAVSDDSSQLRIADSSLAFFTPGPDHVTIDGGTVNIGNASIPITGSVDIASGTVDASISGPVSISGGNINVGGTVVAKNDVKQLASTDTIYSVTQASAVTLLDTTGVDISAYSTLSFTLGGLNVRGVDPSQYLQVGVYQYTLDGKLVSYELPEMFGTGYMSYRTAIVAPVVVVNVQAINNVTVPVGGFRAFAMTATLPHMYMQSPGNTSNAVNLTAVQDKSGLSRKACAVSATVAASTQGTYFPAASYSGPAAVEANTSATTNGTDFAIQIAGTNGVVARSNPLVLLNAGTPNGRQWNGNVQLPESPISLVFNNRQTATANVEAGIVYS